MVIYVYCYRARTLLSQTRINVRISRVWRVREGYQRSGGGASHLRNRAEFGGGPKKNKMCFKTSATNRRMYCIFEKPAADPSERFFRRKTLAKNRRRVGGGGAVEDSDIPIHM